MFRTTLVLFGLILSGCTTLTLDQSHRAQGYDARVSWVVLHYTATDLEHSLHLLTRTAVSSHYLIDTQRIYRLVDEKHRAWHAGDSQWRGRTWLNASSIGIEMVHPGYIDTPAGRQWQPWNPRQIDRLIPLLKTIQTRYDLPVDSIIGHADIAPQRKLDPGPLFPWFRLAREGLIRWPLQQHLQQQIPVYQAELPAAVWFQQQLQSIGYAVAASGEFDEQTRNVLAVLQMKYRPRLFDGQADAETAAILWSLTAQLNH
ncbi:MAG: N-acetylmuramoyl-L-alanine amidase [Thiopseudomonas sp.]|nr:N-acetylmuramoyl-L-alanine amidase [Thiopseudomonas sp.]